ncbi:protein FAM227A-like isoform X1 [Crassostrea virginica]|uniref:Protein FAM227B-like isoform X2 n=1 Tax=Crassostrea virginica TaxID=6565 RepID=A0A8B8CDZ8_CRAVI|nr:protein FAM227B-like isoform X2 [Crassostrea virginica]
MASINRVGSPMDLCEENYDLNQDVLDNKRKFLENKQRNRSPFFIGTIDEVNKKISKLDRKLQKYTALVVESRASNYEDTDDTVSVSSAKGRDRYEKRERETKEINKFAGYFTMKQTFLPGRSERVKNISKVSMQPSKTTIKKETGKPKFVELFQYPGYDSTELTALPDEIPIVEMLEKAVSAHMQLHRKPDYKPHFEIWFYSEMSQAVCSDIFWYLFLDKFQSSKNSQVKLFNRAAFNYVKLMLYVRNPQYRDVFFKDYPTLVAQAIYAAYCHSFPDSYRQFNEQFKEDLVSLVYSWIAGIRPASRCWLCWNFDKLEPPNIKQREEMMNREKNKKTSMSLNFDFLDSLFSSNASQYTSTTSLNQSMSKSSMQSYGGRRGKKLPRNMNRRSSIQSSVSVTSKPHLQSPGSSHDGTIIDYVSESQKPGIMGKKPSPSQSKERAVDARKLRDALTPIRETTYEEDAQILDTQRGDKTSTVSVALTKAPTKIPGRRLRESHPACAGPNYARCVFNINGQSPLVAHYMKMKGLQYDAGEDIRVQRTEIQNLPPLDAPTYRDVIRESFKKAREIEKQYDEFIEKNFKEQVETMMKNRLADKRHRALEKLLLSNPKEVKRLTELIILEQERGDDSLSAGADAAIEASLQAQKCS